MTFCLYAFLRINCNRKICIPFELSAPLDFQLAFFKLQEHRLLPHIVTDKISVSGFGKFLFDLCYSWCEDLDIELFSFFLIAVLYQITQFLPSGKLQPKSFDIIQSFPEQLLTQIKLQKAHYTRYKKIDLISYESWYAWNYLPNRINEIKTKVVEMFSSIFKEDKFIKNYLELIYRTSVQQIIHKDLLKPTASHFLILNKPNQNQSIELNSSMDSNLSITIDSQKSIQTKSHTKIVRKMAMSVLGRTLHKAESGDIGKVHTLKSLQAFLGDVDSTQDIKEDEIKKSTKLYPIWELETSETASLAATGFTEKTNRLDINKTIRNMSSEKVKRSISAQKRKEERSLKTAHSWKRKLFLGEKAKIEETFSNNQSSFFKNFLSTKSRKSLSPPSADQNPKSQIISPTNSIKNFSELQIERKFSMILNDKDRLNRRLSNPQTKAKLRMSLNNKNLFKNVLGEITGFAKRKEGDVKSSKYFGLTTENLNKSSIASPTMHRVYSNKDISFEESKQSKVNFTIIGKAAFQINGEEDLLNGSKEKYGTDLCLTDADQEERIKKYEKIDTIEKLDNMILMRIPKIDTSYASTNSSRPDKFLLNAVRSPTNGEYKNREIESAQIPKDSRKEILNFLKVEFPKTAGNTGTRHGFRVLKQTLTPSKGGKSTPDLFDKTQDKVTKNKKTQEIRLKRIKKPETVKGFSFLQNTDDKIRQCLSPNLVKNITEYSIQ